MRNRQKKVFRDARTREQRRTMTDAERTLWQRLRQLPGGMAHFRRQNVIGPSFANFACHARRLVVEVDGAERGTIEAAQKDDARVKKLEVRGYRVLRFGNSEVLGNIDAVMHTIKESLGADRDARS